MPITIIFVLSELGTMRLLLHHRIRLSELFCIDLSTFLTYLEAVDLVASSANSDTRSSPSSRGRSLRNKKNNNGPKIEPWGTPYLICRGCDTL